MDKSELESVLRRYDERLKEFGHDPRTLGWTKGRHNLRYHILLSQWDLRQASVLDFGCGFGDMYGYSRKIGLDFHYEGIDLNPSLIEAGKKSFPDAVLQARDAFAEGLPKKYDFILSSGVHNLKLKDNWAFIERTFQLFDENATEGFALNFLSKKVEYELADTYHADPSRILDLAYEYSNRVILRNDYMPFEFTIFIDKRKEFDKNHVVYPEFLGLVESESK